MRKYIKYFLEWLPFFIASWVMLIAGIKWTSWEYWVVLLCILFAAMVEYTYGNLEA